MDINEIMKIQTEYKQNLLKLNDLYEQKLKCQRELLKTLKEYYQ